MVETITAHWPQVQDAPPRGSSHEDEMPHLVDHLRSRSDSRFGTAISRGTGKETVSKSADILRAWAHYPPHHIKTDILPFSEEEELQGQLEMLPHQDEVEYIVSQLAQNHLYDFAVAIMNAAVESAHLGRVDLKAIRFLNGWFATMEELVAAGDQLEEILSRRLAPGTSDKK